MKSDAGQTVRREFSSVEQVTKIEKLGKWEQIFYSQPKSEKPLATRKIASNTIDALGHSILRRLTNPIRNL